MQPSDGFWDGVGNSVGSSPGWMVISCQQCDLILHNIYRLIVSMCHTVVCVDRYIVAV